MNIWLIQTGEPLPVKDNTHRMRTALLADSLIGRGHTVVWWASAFDHFTKQWIFDRDTTVNQQKGLTIIALKGTGYRRNISMSRFIDHRIIARKFKSLAPGKERADVIVTATPPYDLAYEAVKFARGNNIPVIVGIRDEWPDLFLDYVPASYQKIIRKLLFRDFRMIESAMQGANTLVAMIGSLLEWGLTYAGRPRSEKDRVFYLGAKGSSPGNIATEKTGFLKEAGDKFIVTFAGTFVRNNDPSILVDCAERLSGSNVLFVLAGDGELLDEIKKRTAALPNVITTGWLNQAEISYLLRHSHIGVCPATRARSAFPNKVFSYLSAGLPVLTAFEGDLKEIIEKYGIGLYFPPNDSNALVNCIKKLYYDKLYYEQMVSNVRNTFNEMFDADKIYEQYAEYIERIAMKGIL